MVLIGFVVLAAAVAFGLDIAWLNQSTIDVEGFGRVVSTTPAALFVAGVVTGLAGALAVMLFRDGFVRRARLRREARVAQAERDRMAEAYERERLFEHANEKIDLRDDDRERVRSSLSDREPVRDSVRGRGRGVDAESDAEVERDHVDRDHVSTF